MLCQATHKRPVWMKISDFKLSTITFVSDRQRAQHVELWAGSISCGATYSYPLLSASQHHQTQALELQQIAHCKQKMLQKWVKQMLLLCRSNEIEYAHEAFQRGMYCKNLVLRIQRRVKIMSVSIKWASKYSWWLFMYYAAKPLAIGKKKCS